MKRLLLLICLVAVGPLLLVGCAEKTADPSGLAAITLAADAVAKPMPDAVLVSAATPGATKTLPPSTWSVIFFSKSQRRIVRVMVTDGKAAEPEVLGQTTVPAATLDKAIAAKDITVDSAQAYAVAAKALRESGNQPTGSALMTISFVAIPGMQGAPGDWLVGFVQGEGNIPAWTVAVDGKTGKPREIK